LRANRLRAASRNDIEQASLSPKQPIFCDACGDDRAKGSFVLIEEITNQTAAAGMIE